MAFSRQLSDIKRRMVILGLLALIGGAPAHVSAEEAKSAPPAAIFHWDAQSISQTLPATAKSAEAWFFLTNTSSETRTILKIESDCDCVTTALDRKQLHPGESAVLVATFHPGTRVGSVSKSIRVISRGKKEAPNTDPLVWKLEIESPVIMHRTDPKIDAPRQSYRVESRLTPSPDLKVPEGLSGMLQLEPAESGTRWQLIADLSKQPQATDQSPLYLIAIPKDGGLRKHIPVPIPPR